MSSTWRGPEQYLIAKNARNGLWQWMSLYATHVSLEQSILWVIGRGRADYKDRSGRDGEEPKSAGRSIGNSSNNASKDGSVDVIEEDLITEVKAVRLHSKPELADTVRRYANITDKSIANKEVDQLDGASAWRGAGSSGAKKSNTGIVESSGITIHGFDDCPFFNDPNTIEFIRNSNTMFIMRGLPGSGKSTIVRLLRHIYPNSVVCSADDYFLSTDGEYRFDHSKLSEAHSKCQCKAREHCEKKTPIVIIDNTNIQRWEMSFYLRLAQSQHYYHTIIIEPQTPWRHDVGELSRRNKHGVDIDTLYGKLKKLREQDVLPIYYGWFLTKSDSASLVKTAKDLLISSVSDLQDRDEVDCTRLKGILEDFDIYYTDPKGILHCTSKFLGSDSPNPYHHSHSVKGSIGRVYTLEISGFIYTERSVSACVNLNSSSSVDNRMLLLYEKEEEMTLRDKYKGTSKSDSALKHFQHGSSAHVTIKVSKNSQPKVSGDDILQICEFRLHGKGARYDTSQGRVHVFPENLFYLEIKELMQFQTLFHGYYSVGRR